MIGLRNKNPNHFTFTSHGLSLTVEQQQYEITYQSAREDLVVRGAHLSPQIVCGDSTCGSGFLPVVHLSIKNRSEFSGVHWRRVALGGFHCAGWETYQQRHELRRGRFGFAHGRHHHRRVSQLDQRTQSARNQQLDKHVLSLNTRAVE